MSALLSLKPLLDGFSLEAAAPDAGRLQAELEHVRVSSLHQELVLLVHREHHQRVVVALSHVEQLQVWELGTAIRHVDERADVPRLRV